MISGPVISKEIEREENLRKAKFGEVQPIVHGEFMGHKIVADGNNLILSNYKYFSQFLFDYIPYIFGKEWYISEIEKAYEERHQVFRWYEYICELIKGQESVDGICAIKIDGSVKAYLCLAYDLYVIRNHAELQQRMVKRLRHKDQFQGARHELFAAAVCIRAGFEIEFEDESKGCEKYPEFVGTHKRTGQKISVEAKSRHREGVLGFVKHGATEGKDTIKLGMGRLLNKALGKTIENPYVIFLDLNLPPTKDKVEHWALLEELKKDINKVIIEKKYRQEPFNLLVFTNIPTHYTNNNDSKPAMCNIFTRHSLNPRMRPVHPQVIAEIDNAVDLFLNIPIDFPKD